MATIYLRNLTGKALQRTAQTGNSSLLDPPMSIPRDDTARWEVTGSGAVTYGLVPDDPTHPPSDLFTLAWDASTPGLMRYTVQDVGRGFTIKRNESANGCTFTASHRDNKRPPVPGPRGAFPVIPLVAILTIAVLAALTFPVVKVIQANQRHGPNVPAASTPTTPPPPPPLSITLTADHTPVLVNTDVLLTATASAAISTGNVIDIVDVTTSQHLKACDAGTICTMLVKSATPTTRNYEALIEPGYKVGTPVATSGFVVVTWSAKALPFKKLTLTANPTSAHDNDAVTLTATSDAKLDGSGYQIEIATGSTIVSTADCQKGVGTTCTARVTNASTQVTYQAFLDKGHLSGLLLSSNTVTVTWSPSAPPPPSPPCCIQLTASATSVTVNTDVTLDTNASSSVTNTGYAIDIFDANGNQVCHIESGSECTNNGVTRSTPATVTYRAYIDTGYQSSVYAQSNTVTVQWKPQRASSIILTASGTTLPLTSNATLTAQTNVTVSGTGTYIELDDLIDSSTVIACSSGAQCGENVGKTTPGSITYQAFVKDSSNNAVLLSSNQVTITWTVPPPPTSLDFSLNGNDHGGSDFSVGANLGDTLDFKATANGSVTNTGYDIFIYDVTDNAQLAVCSSGSTCEVLYTCNSGQQPCTNSYNNATPVDFQAFIATPSQNQASAYSNTAAVTWAPVIFAPKGDMTTSPSAFFAEARKRQMPMK